MKLLFDTEEECKIMGQILDVYDEVGRVNKTNHGIKPCEMSELIRNKIDKFRIKSSFDMIGIVECPNCNKRWTAICSKNTPEVKCSRCKTMVKVFPYVKKRC